MMQKPEIEALLRLLDDPDEQVYEQIRTRLTDYGLEVVPLLEQAWENFSYGVLFQNRVEDIIHQIQFDHVKHLLKTWKDSENTDLLQGMLIINRYQYPDFDDQKIKNAIQVLTRDIWLELNDQLTALEKIKVMNHILFGVHHFIGNTTNYHAPQNSYLSDVFESKKGTPLSLSVIYILLAEQLKLPIYGINLPRHFIVSYLDPSADMHENKIFFYVNPFNKGSILNKRDIEYFLKQLQIEDHERYYTPCSNINIIKRTLHNLIYSYEKLGYSEKTEELKELLFVLTGEQLGNLPE
jgi:regulator of sirC expression with transglutaminase-like and TPR domain